MDLEEVLEHTENTRYLEMIKNLFRQDGFEDTHENRPSTGVKVTYHSYQYGFEVRVKSFKDDGSHSLIVISAE